jgi:hypothetical protein
VVIFLQAFAVDQEMPLSPSTVLDDFSRYILAWKLCTTMAAIGYVAGGAAGVRSGPGQARPWLLTVCRKIISDIWFGDLREYPAHLI